MNKEFKLFLSSTFDKKMHTRRDYFKNEISAHLNKIVGQTGTNLFIYDYEVGIPEETPFAKVLNVCFEKIDTSDYFVAIIDNRYGSIINKDKELTGFNGNIEKFQYLVEKGLAIQYQDLVRNGLKDELSVLELEIIRALENEKITKLFYIRNRTKYKDPEAQKLMQRIEKQVASKNIKYFSRNDTILEELENYFKNEKEVSKGLKILKEEQQNFNLMYANKMRYYVDDKTTLNVLNNYVSDNCNKILALSGKSCKKRSISTQKNGDIRSLFVKDQALQS